jgi:hypothetical protein
MADMLVAMVVFTLIVAVLLAVGVAVTLLPAYVALQLADARHFSTARWFAVSAVGILGGLGLAYLLHRSGAPVVVAVLPLVFTWLGPAVLSLLNEDQATLGGRAGRHE